MISSNLLQDLEKRIVKNPKITFPYNVFSKLILEIVNKKIQDEIIQEMYSLYCLLKGRKESINKSFIYYFTSQDHFTKREIQKKLLIPCSTQRLWIREGLPCLLFKKNINFFKHCLILKNKKDNEGFIYKLLLEYTNSKQNKNLIGFIRGLPKREKDLLFSYLVWKDIDKKFVIPQRYIVYLFSRLESDISEWKKKQPEIISEMTSVSFGKAPKLRAYSLTSITNLEEKKKIIKSLIKIIGKRRVNKIIDNYSNSQRGKEYMDFLEKGLVNINKSFPVLRKYENWLRGQTPNCIRVLLEIYRNKFHRIPKSVLSRIIGWGLGDGGLSKGLQYYFMCGNKKDLEKIKEDLKKYIPNLDTRLKQNDGGEGIIKKVDGELKKPNFKTGKSWIIYMRNSAFCNFLYSYGLPKGEKVLQKFDIPKWIKNGSRKIKKEFLNSLLECENQKHRVKFNKEKKKIEIPAISFGMNKKVRYKNNLICFLKEIKSMLEEFGIECGRVEKPKLSSIRKRDGITTCFTRFHIYCSALNVIKFSKIINYGFNYEKRIALKKAIEEAKVKLNRFIKQIKKYKKAIILHNQKISTGEIAEKLDIGWSTAREWTVNKTHLPRFLNENLEEFINDR